MPLEVSQATPADAKLLAALYADSFAPERAPKNTAKPSRNPWGENGMAQFIAGPGTLCLIGAIGAAPAGFLIARVAADEAELLTLGVLPAYRRQGVARALLAHAIAALHAAGAKKLFLEVDANNAAAVALYCASGAEPVGTRKRYYETGADAAIFSLALCRPRSDDAHSVIESEDRR